METKEIRDMIIEIVKKFGRTAVAELSGNYFSDADIVIGDGAGTREFSVLR